MIARWRWLLHQMTKRLWVRASLFSVLGVATALLAVVFKDYIPASLPARIGADAVDKILGIIASSMLAVTTFSLSTMVAAYGAASSGVTPRATTLVMEDSTTQNALATFIGSFLFSLVGIIALSTGVYGAQGRVLLFAVTIAVVILIVYTLLRWIDHLSRLGRVGETIDRVEEATINAINNRVKWPYLGGVAYPTDGIVPYSTRAITSLQTGYVQHIDVHALGAIAEEHETQIYLDILPGTFVHEDMRLARVAILSNERVEELEACTEKILGALTIGVRRTFEHDPRFGLSVLSEIASRALSPAVNDPGTAIDVLGRGVRSLTCWGKPPGEIEHVDSGCERVFLRGLDVDDLFDDFFAPIARDGASLIEVDLRMMKALISLAQINPDIFKNPCARHMTLLLKRAEHALTMSEDKAKLSALDRTLVHKNNLSI
ncbi:DUF2254 domain-containing protein [Pseudomonas umsongensis]|uniref:DUF2254 domain-containing protein n=2 Tax=Pseudomonas umsongensis TaxID=198618 RepID=A0ABX4E420_9PSED|nr:MULTISPECIES: DUF2254 domain-containing protein [Pseudomonas]EPA96654.1 hypothetical protein PG5_28700 [Pseudomonas sp. G5(2012)]OXR36228.1 hypothetical protein PSUM_02675 [Pseudomonas umsongensis]QFG30507.1 DUF2254 domain-containing protein [Pseudomonas umsongensis]SDT09558.1 Uncharacterized membrane protein [Pseudomonas umsongensis]